MTNIIKWAIKEKDAESLTIQMGGGACTARWLKSFCVRKNSHTLRVKEVQGYEGRSWVNEKADRVDGEEGDEQSSVFAKVDVGFLRDYCGWGH